MHYRIVVPTDARAASILRTTLDWISQDPQMQRDRQRLTRQLRAAELCAPAGCASPFSCAEA
jgi:hypothetical protein